jgi:2,3-bisphosphoglycerate-independent phosphoglycerate mutase
MDAVGGCSIGTLQGRYYAMDRSKNYTLTSEAYACLVEAKGRVVDNAVDAVKESYEKDITPDKTPMVDEYIPPCVVKGYTGMKDGDSVMHFNYRQDRAIQLTQAFVCDDYKGSRAVRPQIVYLGFTRYWDEFTEYLLGAMGGEGGMPNLLGEVISKAGLRQLRIAETQKFRHVTSFFNGKSTQPYAGEDQIDVPGRFDPATFASHPEMEACIVTDELLKRLENNPYAFVAVNFANGDMVGHTGDFDAARQAVEVVDACIGKLLPRLMELDAHILITADHGNSEQMVDYATGMVKTSHTLNDVECIYVAKDAVGVKLASAGKLCDVAPTVLSLMGLEIPADMTAQNLIVGKEDWAK